MKFFMQLLRRSFLIACLAVLLFPAHVFAVPAVTVSIKPLHSLVAAVMEGVGAPSLIVNGAGSEHGYQLRPAEARQLANADIVFWAGPQLEVFLLKPLENLSGSARKVALATVPGVHLLAVREQGEFEEHGHDEAGHEHGHSHDHGEAPEAYHQDLHFWLDPQNAKAAVQEIADVLAKEDPANSERYRENAKTYARRLDALTAEVNDTLAPVRGRPFIVFHDAYQYFEKRFSLSAVGSVTVDPGRAVGAKRVADIRKKVVKSGAVCVFSEPQFEPRLVATIIEGTPAKTGVLDPLGADIAQGPDQYPALIRMMAASLKNCLSR